MNAFMVNKFAGAFLASLLLLMVINGIGNYLVPIEGAEKAHPVEEAQPAEDAEAAVPDDEAGVPPPPAAAMPPALSELLAQASIDDGRKASKKCVTCHTFDNGGPRKVGPNLWGIVGAKVARRDDFRYSKALAEMGGEWGYEQLFAFLADPKAYAPGTNMILKLKKPTDRANVIVYLRSLSDEPLPLPEVELPAAPDAEIPASETPVEETLPTEAPIGTLQSDDEPTTLYIE